MISGECELDQALLRSGAFPALHLLPAAQFSRVKALDPGQFRNLVLTLRDRFDYILIDCPAGIERGLRNVLKSGVDEIILVVTPDDVSVRSAERAFQVIDSKALPRPRLIVNRLDADLIYAREMMSARTVSEVMDLPLLGEIPEDKTFCQAMLRHSLVYSYQCEARRAFMRIGCRLTGWNIPFPEYGRKVNRSLLRRMRRKPREVIPLDDH